MMGSQRESAERRQCPQCGRKSALKYRDDGTLFCRWSDCRYRRPGKVSIAHDPAAKLRGRQRAAERRQGRP